METQWTITELAETATAALGDAPVRVNGRVRDVPNTRLIRWYTTIGLMDPPSGRRGRTALYGRRHLLQLVAIKRRQSAGRTIAQIQTELIGATDATLNEIARLPDEPGEGVGVGVDSGRGRFWAQPAAIADTGAPPAGGRPSVVAGVRLAPGVTLVLDAVALTEADLDAIGAAAGTLLGELHRRGLIPVSSHDPAPPTEPNGSRP
ncbi:MerR family transcriptional regulator [Thermomonospora umbrina]|uniref:MerR-like DNA binding protein n=1 Tax=Thermomonospora umbrina TaxID=111806 RepID=A0A3D9SPN3_9ACTN|nr:MerR family transcriptional regulator [Thermomonospora umbrina]REE97926.1 MerR-like DNA binding protein [Thermomonospora umbrina]